MKCTWLHGPGAQTGKFKQISGNNAAQDSTLDGGGPLALKHSKDGKIAPFLPLQTTDRVLIPSRHCSLHCMSVGMRIKDVYSQYKNTHIRKWTR